jgi:hypothetical protein
VDALTLLNIALALANLAVAGFQGWKEWRTRAAAPHPLAASLDDIAAAIRERREWQARRRFPEPGEQ